LKGHGLIRADKANQIDWALAPEEKLSNHEAAIALHYMHYNFCRIHKSLRCTLAMEAGIADHVWSAEELVSLLEPKSILDGLKMAV
jgi:hypothetical protein